MNLEPTNYSQYATERNVHFLNESNRIEGIKEIDYAQSKFQQSDRGHFGAFILSQEAARRKEPLTLKMIKLWQKLITEEQIPFGHHMEKEEVGHIRGPSLQKNVRIASHIPPDWSKVPSLLSYLIEDINASLKDKDSRIDDVELCNILGNSFQRFEAIHPFADGNGRTGRLIANYIATYCGRPIIVFDSEYAAKNKYYKAHESKKAMCGFMANKIKEAVYGIDGTLLLKSGDSSGSSSIYKSQKGDKAEIVEWHHLDAAFQEGVKKEAEIKGKKDSSA